MLYELEIAEAFGKLRQKMQMLIGGVLRHTQPEEYVDRYTIYGIEIDRRFRFQKSAY